MTKSGALLQINHLDIIDTGGGQLGIVDKVYADGSCSVYFELCTHSVIYTALQYRPTWRVVG